MSFVSWQAQKQALLVDDILVKLGISLVSKYHYCASPQQESIDHILCNGDLAITVWNYFVGLLGVQLPHHRCWQFILNIWWLHASSSSQVGCCRGPLPIIIMWALWRVRCDDKMEGTKRTGEVWGTELNTHYLVSFPHTGISKSCREINILHELDFSIAQVITWKPKVVAQCKLN